MSLTILLLIGLAVLILTNIPVAPVALARSSPGGIMLEDGYQALVTFKSDPDFEVWEKTVQPPGLDGGDAIDTTTMHNVEWRSTTPRALKTMTSFKMKCAYDPIIYTSLTNSINVETTITVRFADGTTLAFYGFLQSVEFDELAEGTHPECTITVTPTNSDPTTGDEEDPVLTNVSGT